MSLTAIKPYFTARLTALNFTEWNDGFQDDNIPSTILDQSFFQQITSVTGIQTNNNNIEMSVTNEVRCYFKGFNDPKSAIDECILRSEAVIKECVKVVNQVGSAVKGVYLNSLSIEPLELDLNDNIVRAVIVFDVRVFVCLD